MDGYTRLGVGVGSCELVMNFSSSGEAIFSICRSGELRIDTGAGFTDELKRCRLAISDETATPSAPGLGFRSSVSGRFMAPPTMGATAGAVAAAVVDDEVVAGGGIGTVEMVTVVADGGTGAATADAAVADVLGGADDDVVEVDAVLVAAAAAAAETDSRILLCVICVCVV